MTPKPTPLPKPPTPPPEPVTVSLSSAALAFDAPTLTITGTGFDAANSAANLVFLGRGLSPGAVVTAATATTLTVSLPAPGSSPPPERSTGPLTAAVTITSRGVSSGAPVQVATVILPLLNWRGAGASGDGSRLFLAANANGTIWRSLDGGVSFAPTTAPIRNWQVSAVFLLLLSSSCHGFSVSSPRTLPSMKTKTKKSVSSDATGTHLAAAAYGDSIYLSNDGGASFFVPQSGSSGLPAQANWGSVSVSSADGAATVAAAENVAGGLWVSHDSGNSFSLITGGGAPTAADWRSVAVSADGSKVVGVVKPGDIWRSADGGTTMTAVGGSGGAPSPAAWRYVCSSASGSTLAAVVSGGAIWVSRDAGTTWSQAGPTAPTAAAWSGCSLSADGSRLAATHNGGNIYLSADAGATTGGQSGVGGAPTVTDWYSIAGSASGQKLIAGIFFGNVWVSSDAGASWEIR